MNGWRKSSHSANNGACAEVGQDGASVLMRDSKDPDGPWLAFDAGAWDDFLYGIRQDAYLVPRPGST